MTALQIIYQILIDILHKRMNKPLISLFLIPFYNVFNGVNILF